MLNGKDLTVPFISQNDILKGGKLVLKMGAKPNKKWGTDTSKYPSVFKY